MTTRTTSNGKAPKRSSPLARAYPQNLVAERALLGSILLDGGPVLDDVCQIIQPSDLYFEVHARVLALASELHSKGQPIDPVLIHDTAKAQGIEGIDVELLTELVESVPHSGHAAFYAKSIEECSRRRQAISAATYLLDDAFDDTKDIGESVTAGESRLHAVIERNMGGQAIPVAQVLLDIVPKIGTARKRGISTGFHDFDALTDGLHPGRLIILAARTSVGKTAFAGNIALQAAEAGEGVLFVSLEQSREELSERFICSRANVDTKTLHAQKLDEAILDSITTAAAKISKLKLLIDDNTPRTISQIAALARIHHRRDKIGLVVVDYLQLISPEDKRTPREQQVAEISRGLKLLARGLRIPVIALAQLNREVEKRVGAERRPRLSDLRESGAIEQDADVIVFLDRPRTYDDDADESTAKLHVSKNRNSRTGMVDLHWHARTMTFRNAARTREGSF
jgi:replicative DNA helicase